MKQNKFFLGLATIVAAAFAFTSCSSDELDNQAIQKSGSRINFTYGSAMTRTFTDPQSGTSVSTGLNVGIFGVSSEETTTMTNYNNNKYVTAASNAISLANGSSDMTWPTTSEATANIYAYAPYQDSWTVNAANSFSVLSDQSTDANYLASDLLYASAPSQAQGTTVNLAFSHKLAKINVTITKEEGSNVDLTNATVIIKNTKPTTTLTPSTGALGDASGDATDITAATNLGTNTTACAVIVPQTINAGTELVRITAGEKTLIAKLGTNTTFASGNSYNFTVNVGTVDDSSPSVVTLALGTTSVTAWGSNDLGAVSFPKWYATFSASSGSFTYENNTYTWTANNNNLMTCFEFSHGELVNYKSFVFQFSELSESQGVRAGYYVGSSFTSFSEGGYYSAGKKVIDLTNLGVDLSTVTKISFGGKTNGGSCTILPSNVYLSVNTETE